MTIVGSDQVKDIVLPEVTGVEKVNRPNKGHFLDFFLDREREN